MSSPDATTRTAARILFALAWLLGAGAVLLARAGEPGPAWIVGITAVVLVAGAVAVAMAAARAEDAPPPPVAAPEVAPEPPPTRTDQEIRP